MKRWRWMLRGIMVGLAVICAGLWVESYFRTPYVSYANADHRFAAGIVEGGFYVVYQPHGLPFPVGWDADIIGKEKREDWAPWFYLGFNGGMMRPPPVAPSVHIYFVRVPMWFVTAGFAGLAWWVWRRTRRKTGGGFPVEGTGHAEA